MNRKNIFLFSLLVFISSLPLFLSFNRGINYFDEGYILEAARRIAAGELPYRDFHFMYTPATVYYLSFFLRLGGQFVIVERIAALLMSIFGIIFLGLLTRKLTKNHLLTFLSMFLYSLWGPTHLNFMWPVMSVLPLVFCYLFLFLGSRYFLSGIVIALILLTKQNFGAAVIISFLSSFIWVRQSKRHFFSIIYGFVSIMFLFLAHLYITGSTLSFVADINRYTIQEILIRKSFSVPFPTDSLGKFFLYLSPALISVAVGIGLVWQKKKRRLIIIPLTTLAIYLLGIFPTPDWPHLTPLLGILGILFILVPSIFGSRSRWISFTLLVFVIGAGILSLFLRNYYRWESPLINNIHCFSSGRLKYMCLDDKNYTIIMQTVPTIEKEAMGDSYIFAFYNNPIYYFITKKNIPTNFINFDVLIGKKEELRVISELKKKKVGVIITRFPPRNVNSPTLVTYLEKNYTPVHEIYEFMIWKKRN